MDFFKNEKIPISQINMNQILNKNIGDRENLLNELEKINEKNNIKIDDDDTEEDLEKNKNKTSTPTPSPGPTPIPGPEPTPTPER